MTQILVDQQYDATESTNAITKAVPERLKDAE